LSISTRRRAGMSKLIFAAIETFLKRRELC
jgi:hypothetical protein